MDDYEGTLDWAENVGIFDRGAIVEHNDQKDLYASMHLFEFTTQQRQQSGQVFPLQTIFALKEQNMQKLNSHLWFFSGFAPPVPAIAELELD